MQSMLSMSAINQSPENNKNLNNKNDQNYKWIDSIDNEFQFGNNIGN